MKRPIKALLTEDELEMVDMLDEVMIKFTKLPVLSMHDESQFVSAIHAAQHIILSRPCRDESKEGRNYHAL